MGTNIISDAKEEITTLHTDMANGWMDFVNVIHLYAAKIVTLFDPDDVSNLSTKVDTVIGASSVHTTFIDTVANKHGVTPQHVIDLTKIAVSKLTLSETASTASGTASGTV
jgi:hypothetical protein